jgi:hypothetical protein
MTVEQRIEPYLTAAEAHADIGILGAWDTGSHAWGYATDESDYDISCLFVQPPSQYSLLTGYKESISVDGSTLSEEATTTTLPPEQVELTGWNARYLLELGVDSNPAFLEMLFSPLPFRTHPALEEMRTYIETRFNIIDAYNHYRGFAKSNYERYVRERDESTVKRWLYILRGALHAEYILATHSFPPLHLPTCLDSLPPDLAARWPREAFEALLDEKRAGNGATRVDGEFEQYIERLDAREVNYREHIREERIKKEELDAFMQRLLDARTFLQ